MGSFVPYDDCKPKAHSTHTDTCLCTSGIFNFLATNVVAQAAVAVVGQAATTASLTNMVCASVPTMPYELG